MSFTLSQSISGLKFFGSELHLASLHYYFTYSIQYTVVSNLQSLNLLILGNQCLTWTRGNRAGGCVVGIPLAGLTSVFGFRVVAALSLNFKTVATGRRAVRPAAEV
jgi:hypothetical protein